MRPLPPRWEWGEWGWGWVVVDPATSCSPGAPPSLCATSCQFLVWWKRLSVLLALAVLSVMRHVLQVCRPFPPDYDHLEVLLCDLWAHLHVPLHHEHLLWRSALQAAVWRVSRRARLKNVHTSWTWFHRPHICGLLSPLRLFLSPLSRFSQESFFYRLMAGEHLVGHRPRMVTAASLQQKRDSKSCLHFGVNSDKSKNSRYRPHGSLRRQPAGEPLRCEVVTFHVYRLWA